MTQSKIVKVKTNSRWLWHDRSCRSSSHRAANNNIPNGMCCCKRADAAIAQSSNAQVTKKKSKNIYFFLTVFLQTGKGPSASSSSSQSLIGAMLHSRATATYYYDTCTPEMGTKRRHLCALPQPIGQCNVSGPPPSRFLSLSFIVK